MANIRMWVWVVCAAVACGDDSTDESSQASTGDTDTTTTTSTTSTSATTAATSATSSSTSATSTSSTTSTSTTDDGTGSTSSSGTGDSTGGIVLEGDPPAPQTFSAVDAADFERLPDDDDHTDFAVEGGRLQILPLRNENFPPNVNYCVVGSDDDLNDLQQWARARLLASPKTWYYDVTLTVIAEEDGESEFALVIDGDIAEMIAAPNTEQTGGVDDMDAFAHTWNAVPIEQGSTVEIWGRAHSNLTLEEPAGCRTWSPTYAWARGRWTQLELTASPGFP